MAPDKNGLVALLLCLLGGVLGLHRWYANKYGTAVLYILTLGGFGIWQLYDIYQIVTNSFTTKDGQFLTI